MQNRFRRTGNPNYFCTKTPTFPTKYEKVSILVPVGGLCPRAKKRATGTFFAASPPPCSSPCRYEISQTPIRGSGKLVPVGGIEPPRCCHRRILSPLRLPFHHTGVLGVLYTLFWENSSRILDLQLFFEHIRFLHTGRKNVPSVSAERLPRERRAREVPRRFGSHPSA